jgi:pyridoxamine 5'-phosphate oxidase
VSTPPHDADPARADRLAAMRNDYTRGKLDEQDLHPDPIEQFALWFTQACTGELLEPNAMSLATATSNGAPSLRTVLLKGYDTRGFVFFTNYQSRKAREIAQNPNVALLFPWLALERQVIITGTAEKISAAETAKYFVTRPRGSQLSAWVSMQSSVVATRKALEAEWDRLKQRFARGEIPVPSFWGGYRVKPLTIEFWQGRASRLHDRFLYTRQSDEKWTIARLSP